MKTIIKLISSFLAILIIYTTNSSLAQNPFGKLNPNNPFSEVSSPFGKFNPNNPFSEGNLNHLLFGFDDSDESDED